MRPARTTKKANPVNSGKNNTTASSQGRRDAGAVVSKSPTQFEEYGETNTRLLRSPAGSLHLSKPQPLLNYYVHLSRLS